MSFRPMPVLTLFTVLSLALLVWLGNWQYGRFLEKMALDKSEPEWTVIDGTVVPGSEAMVYSYIDAAAAWRRVVAIDTGEEVVFTPTEVIYQVEPPQPCQGPDCGAGLRFSARGLYQVPRGRNAFSGTDSPVSMCRKPAPRSRLPSPTNPMPMLRRVSCRPSRAMPFPRPTCWPCVSAPMQALPIIRSRR